MTETHTIPTRPIKHLEKFALLAWRDKRIAVFSGREGIGKSEGFRCVAASNSFPKIAFRSRPTISNTGLLEELRVLAKLLRLRQDAATAIRAVDASMKRLEKSS